MIVMHQQLQEVLRNVYPSDLEIVMKQMPVSMRGPKKPVMILMWMKTVMVKQTIMTRMVVLVAL